MRPSTSSATVPPRSSATPFEPESPLADPARLHRALAEYNARRFRPTLPTAAWADTLREDIEFTCIEGAFVESERAEVQAWASEAPTDPDAFVAWFTALKDCGPGQGDLLFPWLAREASMGELTWFLTQEVAGEAGFEDLVALAQVKLPARPKLEMARNYWDEMGRGNEGGMHGPMLATLARDLDLAPTLDNVVWESLALGNTMAALACTRRYAYHAIGALGVIELTAPGRAEYVNEALARHGVQASTRRYFALHATLDVKHSAAWNSEVLHPLVAERPEVASALAEGALMRLAAGARCFERYRHELGVW